MVERRSDLTAGTEHVIERTHVGPTGRRNSPLPFAHRRARDTDRVTDVALRQPELLPQSSNKITCGFRFRRHTPPLPAQPLSPVYQALTSVTQHQEFVKRIFRI